MYRLRPSKPSLGAFAAFAVQNGCRRQCLQHPRYLEQLWTRPTCSVRSFSISSPRLASVNETIALAISGASQRQTSGRSLLSDARGVSLARQPKISSARGHAGLSGSDDAASNSNDAPASGSPPSDSSSTPPGSSSSAIKDFPAPYRRDTLECPLKGGFGSQVPYIGMARGRGFKPTGPI